MTLRWVVAAVLVAALIWMATRPPQVDVGPDSVIDLVYLGGPDCPYCRSWEANELPRLREMAEYRHIRFTHVLKAIQERVPEEGRLPAHLQTMRAELLRQTGGRAGSPQFVLLVDGIAVRGGFGTQAYHDLVPTLSELVTRKTGRPMLPAPE